MKIGIDIDGVLGNILIPLANRMEQEFNVKVDFGDLDKFDLTETLRKHDIKSTWLFKVYKDAWFWSETVPYDENIETLNKWRADGHEIHLLTARHADAAMPTSAWLKKHKVNYSKLEFVRSMKKHETMLKDNIPVIFEDRFFEAQKCASYGMCGFVVRRSYNIEYEGRSFNSLVSFIDKLSDGQDFIDKYQEFTM